MKTTLHFDDNEETYCWTDSQIVLYWIKSIPSKWKTFVANRVSEIQTLTSPKSWFHCPGKSNPADILSRGVLGEQLLSHKMWLNGPEWLHVSLTVLNVPLNSSEEFEDEVALEAPRVTVPPSLSL